MTPVQEELLKTFSDTKLEMDALLVLFLKESGTKYEDEMDEFNTALYKFNMYIDALYVKVGKVLTKQRYLELITYFESIEDYEMCKLIMDNI